VDDTNAFEEVDLHSGHHLDKRSPAADPFLYEIVYIPPRNFGGRKGHRGGYGNRRGYSRGKRSVDDTNAFEEVDLHSDHHLDKRSPAADPFLYEIVYIPPRNFGGGRGHRGGYGNRRGYSRGKRSVDDTNAFEEVDLHSGHHLDKRSPAADPFLYEIVYIPPRNFGGRKGHRSGYGNRRGKRSADAGYGSSVGTEGYSGSDVSSGAGGYGGSSGSGSSYSYATFNLGSSQSSNAGYSTSNEAYGDVSGSDHKGGY